MCDVKCMERKVKRNVVEEDKNVRRQKEINVTKKKRIEENRGVVKGMVW